MSIASSLLDVPHPGEFLSEELEARGWMQRDLAYILGVPEQAINMIVSGKRGISPEMSKALGDAFDIAPEFFSNLQAAFEMSKARAPDPGVARRALFQGAYPIREMIRRGWLEDTDVGMLEAQLMRFFRKNTVDEIPYLAYAAKKSDYSQTSPADLAWLFRVRQVAAEMIVPSYSKKKLREALAEFPRHMVDPEEVRHVPRTLAKCGVRFVIVETLPKASIDGVCFWDDQTPVVGMTTRYDRIDNFWFVLRHEIEHVLNEDGKNNHDLGGTKIDDLDAQAAQSNLPAEEVRANTAAEDFCVPISEMDSFYVRKAPFISEKDVLGFAGRIQRHPGIVVGQLQRRLKRHDYLARYKVKVRQHIAQAAVTDGWGVAAPTNL